MTEQIRQYYRLVDKVINDAYHQLSAFLSGTCTESHSGSESGTPEEARKRAVKETKAHEEAASRASRAAEARAREEAIRQAAEARVSEQARLREITHRRLEEQARQTQVRLRALLYDDIVMALTDQNTRTNHFTSLVVRFGKSFGFFRRWQFRLLGRAV